MKTPMSTAEGSGQMAKQQITVAMREHRRVEAQRDDARELAEELLAALEGLVAACTIPDEDEPETMTQARAAIAKAGGAA